MEEGCRFLCIGLLSSNESKGLFSVLRRGGKRWSLSTLNPSTHMIKDLKKWVLPKLTMIAAQLSYKSEKHVWDAFHKLEFKAHPKRRYKNEWVCSLLCKNEKDEVQTFSSAQNTEKHVMRKHPDPGFNNFVCLICEKKNVSPQQILDHLAQKKEKKGHGIKDKVTKDNNIRAIDRDTGARYRFFSQKNCTHFNTAYISSFG